MAYKFLGIESSDGDACECCGTACPKRRTVVEDESGNQRRLGRDCAAMALRPSDAAKARRAHAAAAKRDGRIDKARKWAADGIDPQAVIRWLRCWGIEAQISDRVLVVKS